MLLIRYPSGTPLDALLVAAAVAHLAAIACLAGSHLLPRRLVGRLVPPFVATVGVLAARNVTSDPVMLVTIGGSFAALALLGVANPQGLRRSGALTWATYVGLGEVMLV